MSSSARSPRSNAGWTATWTTSFPSRWRQYIEALGQVRAQDLEGSHDGGTRIRQGVAPDRRISPRVSETSAANQSAQSSYEWRPLASQKAYATSAMVGIDSHFTSWPRAYSP
jgi:hypothetical protein